VKEGHCTWLSGQDNYPQRPGTRPVAVSGKHLANLDVQIASFHRAQTVDKLSEALIIESITKIQARRMEDWPSF